MPTFELTSPDGQTYEVDGPDGATPAQAFGVLQGHLKTAAGSPPAAQAAPVDHGPADNSDPLTRIAPSTPSTGASDAIITPAPQAGGGRGFVNPPAAVQAPRDVGFVESAGRGWGRAGATAAQTANLAGSLGGVVYDKLHSLATGKLETGAQDALFRSWVDPTQDAIDWYALKPDERSTFLGKVGDAVGAMAQDLPLMIASGGASKRAELAQQFPTIGRYLENAFSQGFDAMRPIMVKAGVEKAKQVLEAGGSVPEAVNSATTAAMLTGFQGGQPMSATGNLAQRVATGVPVGMAQSEAGRAIQNAADPEGLQRPFDPAEMAAGGVTNAMAAGAMGHSGPGRIPDRIDLGYDPLTGKTPVAEAVQGMGEPQPRPGPGRAEPARDHVADILNADSVEEAAQSALKLAERPAVGDIAAELRAIRPTRPVDLAEGNPDERADAEVPADAAGAVGPGSADAAGGLGVRDRGDLVPGAAMEPAGVQGEAEARPAPVGDRGGDVAVDGVPAAVHEQQPAVVERVGSEAAAASAQAGENGRPGLSTEDVAAQHAEATAGETLPLFKRSEQEAPAVSGAKRAQITDLVSGLTRDWLRKPDIHILGSMDEAPEPVRRVFEQQNSAGAAGGIEGFHWRGGVYLVGDALQTKGDVQRVLFHEALGHFGLRGVFGGGLDKVLNEVAGSMPRELAEKAKQYGFDLADARHRQMAAEEVLAELAQTRPELGIVTRAVAAIRTFLREHGIDSLRMTREEIIRNYILPARDFVERGRSAEPSFAAQRMPQFSRKDDDAFYSGLARGVEGIPAKMQGGDGWRAQIDGLINKGAVKRDEVEWSGLNEWLRAQPGKVTKQQVLNYLDHNGVQVHEVMHSDDGHALDAQGNKIDDGAGGLVMKGKPTKYGNYVLPGGQNYRELLLTLPEVPNEWSRINREVNAKIDALADKGINLADLPDSDPRKIDIKGLLARGNDLPVTSASSYRSGHWDEPNILAHIRLNDRTDTDGKKVLFVEELQSDWAQEGRKRGFMPKDPKSPTDDEVRQYFDLKPGADPAEYREEMVEALGRRPGWDRVEGDSPVLRAPFVDSTDKWLPLALKRVVKYAADKGYDRVAFVSGKQSADRYDLSKHVDTVLYDPSMGTVIGRKNGGNVLTHTVQHSDQIADVVGKDVAKKLLESPKNRYGMHEVSGVDLKVGGEGMRTFYDSIVPNAANKVLARLGGGKVGEVRFGDVGPDLQAIASRQYAGADYDMLSPAGRAVVQEIAAREGKTGGTSQPGFDVTPAMRERTSDGVPMFSRSGTTAATAGMPTTAPGGKWERSKSVVSDLIDEGLSRTGVYRFTAPMSEGSVRARAVAQNFANAERLARAQWQRVADILQQRFTPEDRRQMWEAADEQNTLLQQGTETAGRGLERLSPKQRDVVEQLHTYGEELLRRAKNAGMFQGEGLPYWTPRMMVMLDEHGEYARPAPEPGKKQTSGGDGRNVFTSSSNLKQRKYLTAEETEAAMKAKGGELVKDIMTMPLAMQRLEKAIAGRELINQIKELGRATGEPTVQNGRPGDGWFTLDHSAFTTFQPRFERDAATGKLRPLLDEKGEMVFDRVPLYMSKEFEGPIKAILSNQDGAFYRGLMLLKSKAMSAIMFSPLIHNLVIFGRALGYDPTMAGTVALYFKGHAARQDNELLRTAIDGGMVPMGGNRSGMIDVTDIARGIGREGGLGDPNESWIAHGARAIVGAVNKEAGAAAKRFVDKAGDFWHGTLLWDRVGDLQMGIFAHAYDRLLEKGFEPGAAKVLAAHWANRYAGAVGRENMGEYARKAANVLLFSRSFNMGNLGTVKDLVYGMPSGLRAKIEAEYGRAGASKIFTEARRKAWSGFTADAAMSLIALSLAQSAVDRLKKDKGWDEIFGGYTERASRMWENVKAHPANPKSYSPWQLSPTHDNEPGKADRVDMGQLPDAGGRHEYMRLPTGKVVEDLFNWTTHLPATFESKTSPLAKAVWTALTNDKGFGVPVYDLNGRVDQGAVDVAKHLAKAQVPWDTIVTAWDRLNGKASQVEKDKLAGNMTGFTFSQGHPQGPAAGVAAEVEDRIHAQRMMAMEEVKRLLKYDHEDQAREKLEAIGLSPREITQILQRIDNPKDGMTRGQQKRFNQHGTEEDQQRMDRVTR